MVNVASPSPKKTLKDAAKAVKHSPITKSGKAVRGSQATRTATPQTTKTTKTRRRKRKEGDWTYKEDERVYILEPHRPDVHKFTLVYLHYASGHPKEYFTVDGFQTPGLRVVLPKAPVYESMHYGDGTNTCKSRVWYDYYLDPKDPNEDPSQGADAEELWEASPDLDGEDEEDDAEDPDYLDACLEKIAMHLLGRVEEKKEKAKEEEKEAEEEKAVKFSEFIKTLSPDTPPETNTPKQAQVKKSIDRVLAIIHKEAEALGGDYSRIFLGGWSQGGVLAMNTAIHKDCPSLGGVLTVTGTCHNDCVDAAVKEPGKSTPFVLYVGIKDDTYPVMLLMPMIERLRAVGYQIEVREKNMDHCLNGNIGAACKVEERWMKQWIEAFYQDSSLGALMSAHSTSGGPSGPFSVTAAVNHFFRLFRANSHSSSSTVAPLNSKDHEAAVKVVYSLLFGNKLPHNREAEIMKHSYWEATMSDMNKRVNKLSADDLTLVAKFFGAESCTAPDLARLLATPTATALAALRSGSAPMSVD